MKESIKMKIRVTTTEEMLGSQPGDPEIHKTYIASKAPDAASLEDEIAAMGEEAVLEWLDYGKLRGLGQWRNSGKGRFEYEVVEGGGDE